MAGYPTSPVAFPASATCSFCTDRLGQIDLRRGAFVLPLFRGGDPPGIERFLERERRRVEVCIGEADGLDRGRRGALDLLPVRVRAGQRGHGRGGGHADARVTGRVYPANATSSCVEAPPTTWSASIWLLVCPATRNRGAEVGLRRE